MSPCAASSSSRAALARAWDDGGPTPFAAFDRLGRAYLGIRPDRSPPIIRPCSRPECRSIAIPNCARGRARVCSPAGGIEQLDRDHAGPHKRPPALMMALHIWAVAWHRVAVRPRRCGTATAADVARRTPRGQRADLPAGPGGDPDIYAHQPSNPYRRTYFDALDRPGDAAM